jgi:hypothetical protein
MLPCQLNGWAAPGPGYLAPPTMKHGTCSTRHHKTKHGPGCHNTQHQSHIRMFIKTQKSKPCRTTCSCIQTSRQAVIKTDHRDVPPALLQNHTSQNKRTSRHNAVRSTLRPNQPCKPEPARYYNATTKQASRQAAFRLRG